MAPRPRETYGDERDDRASLDGLRELPPSLLNLTFDQLRTFVLLAKTRSPSRTAATLGRDQSSVHKQLRALNDHFSTLVGEPLAPFQARKDLALTPTGELVASLSEELLEHWHAAVLERRGKRGSVISIGATLFVLDFVGGAWNSVMDQLKHSEIKTTIRQIRTREIHSVLHTYKVDVTLGGIVHERDRYDLDDPDIAFLPWDWEPLVLVTNDESLNDKERITPADLTALPLIAPTPGIVDDFLQAWYGTSYVDDLELLPVEGDIIFNLSLLRSKSVRGSMIVPEYLWRLEKESPDGLRMAGLRAPDRPDLEAVAGIFVRRKDLALARADHPLSLVWKFFAREAVVNAASKERNLPRWILESADGAY